MGTSIVVPVEYVSGHTHAHTPPLSNHASLFLEGLFQQILQYISSHMHNATTLHLYVIVIIIIIHAPVPT